MLLSEMPRRRLGVSDSEAALKFGRADASKPFSSRYLYLAGKPAFELSMWCGTCPFIFERKEEADRTLSSDREPFRKLESPLSTVGEDVIQTFGALLPHGEYLPMLLELRPELVAPNDERDYFAHEQVDTWGIDGFWGLPENPRTFYYRTFETQVDRGEHLYEFVVPMVPPGWNDRERASHYRKLMNEGSVPTAVALSTLDVCQPATDNQSADYYGHWGLTHFLLDGHHKMQAAAETGGTVQLLTFVSLEDSLARSEDIARLPELLSQPARRRMIQGAAP